jgi:exopolysaccharide production protein ExoZ
VFAVLLFTKTNRLLYCALLFTALIAAGSFVPPDSALRFYCRPVILEFVAGMAIGQYYRLVKLHWAASAGLVVAGFVVLLQPFNMWVTAAAATSVVLGVLTLEPRIPRIRPLALLGDASYSIYLTHLFVFGATRVIWKGGPYGFVVFSMAAVIAVSILSYRWIERPFLRITQPRRPQDAVAVPAR